MPWYAYLLFSIQVITFAVIILLKPKKTEEKTPDQHEDKIFQLYSQIEEMLDSFEAYVGEMHAGLEDKRQELIELNRQAQVVYMQVMATNTVAALPQPQPQVNPEPEPATQEQPTVAAPSFTSAAPPKKKAAKPQKEAPSRLTDMDKEALGRLATKPQKVRFLMSRGLSLDEVAKELDIGRGEVILIADLDKT